MIYCVDIDGTICQTRENFYKEAIPKKDIIEKINYLYDSGHIIKYYTARGGTSGIDWADLTIKQLNEWGAKYHKLIMNQKPHFDLLIDDKCINIEAWKKLNGLGKRGFIAGSFEVI